MDKKIKLGNNNEITPITRKSAGSEKVRNFFNEQIEKSKDKPKNEFVPPEPEFNPNMVVTEKTDAEMEAMEKTRNDLTNKYERSETKSGSNKSKDAVTTFKPKETENSQKKKGLFSRLGRMFGGKSKKLVMTAGLMATSMTANGKNVNNNINRVLNDTTNNIEKSITNNERISDQLRHDWNNYIDWLTNKGMAGKAELDKNDLGGKMIDEYRVEMEKQRHTTLVSRGTVKDVQEEFRKYRQWTLDQIHVGKSVFDQGVNENNYMKNLSIVDDYAGQRTTSFKFPKMYLEQMDKAKAKVEDLGFAKVGKEFTADNTHTLTSSDYERYNNKNK